MIVLALSAPLPRPYGPEAGGGVGRALIGLLAALVLWKLDWLRRSRLSSVGHGRPWSVASLSLVYLVVVYSLLFSGRIGLELNDPILSLFVAMNGLISGVMEEIVFRGLVLTALLVHWKETKSGACRATILSAVLFGLPHALNLLTGADPVRVGAQVVWATLLGVFLAQLVLAADSVWPAAALHGLANAWVHANRLGVSIEPRGLTAALMILAPLPLLLGGVLLLRREDRPGHGPEDR